jgi:hypothetical protein
VNVKMVILENIAKIIVIHFFITFDSTNTLNKTLNDVKILNINLNETLNSIQKLNSNLNEH